jgi:hypothetical protein
LQTLHCENLDDYELREDICFMDCKNGWTLFWMLAKNVIFAKNWKKKTKLKQFMLVSFKKIQQIMKCSSHNLKPYFIFP